LPAHARERRRNAPAHPLRPAPPAPQYCRIIQRLGFEAEFKEFTIQNVVASCDCKFPIRLEGLQYSHAYFATVREGGGGSGARRRVSGTLQGAWEHAVEMVAVCWGRGGADPSR
jgi:hypothetical protein